MHIFVRTFFVHTFGSDEYTCNTRMHVYMQDASVITISILVCIVIAYVVQFPPTDYCVDVVMQDAFVNVTHRCRIHED